MWEKKILNFGSLETIRNVNTALGWLPANINAKAANTVAAFVILPKNGIGIEGASFPASRTILIFENEDEIEEQLTVLHEIAHILDPGWPTHAFHCAFEADKGRAPAKALRLANRSGASDFERFAEISSFFLAAASPLKHFPRCAEIVCEALNWDNS